MQGASGASRTSRQESQASMGERIFGHELPLTWQEAESVAKGAAFGGTVLPAPEPVEAGALYTVHSLGNRPSCVAMMGAFDGLHLGHQALIAAARADAAVRGLPLVAITFSPDPSEVLFPAHPERRLLSCEDRVRGLIALGADAVLAVPFTRELAALDPEAYLGRIARTLAPAALHVGTNFRFGAGGRGTAQTLSALGPSFGMDVVPQDLSLAGTEPVSATRIRHLLAQGSLEKANRLLGRCHFVRGEVLHGRGEGTGMGFATANVQCAALSQMPAEGVYGGYAVVDGVPWASAINVGAPKSFGQEERPDFLEAHLIGFSGDLYGQEVEIVFCSWLREARTFTSIAELERVVRQNIEWVQANLSARQEGVSH